MPYHVYCLCDESGTVFYAGFSDRRFSPHINKTYPGDHSTPTNEIVARMLDAGLKPRLKKVGKGLSYKEAHVLALIARKAISEIAEREDQVSEEQ